MKDKKYRIYALGALSVAKGLTTGVAMAAFSLCLAYTNDWRKQK